MGSKQQTPPSRLFLCVASPSPRLLGQGPLSRRRRRQPWSCDKPKVLGRWRWKRRRRRIQGSWVGGESTLLFLLLLLRCLCCCSGERKKAPRPPPIAYPLLPRGGKRGPLQQRKWDGGKGTHSKSTTTMLSFLFRRRGFPSLPSLWNGGPLGGSPFPCPRSQEPLFPTVEEEEEDARLNHLLA